MRLSEGGGRLGLKLVVGPARLENRVESVVRSEQFVGPERLRFSAGMVSGQMRGLGGGEAFGCVRQWKQGDEVTGKVYGARCGSFV